LQSCHDILAAKNSVLPVIADGYRRSFESYQDQYRERKNRAGLRCARRTPGSRGRENGIENRTCRRHDDQCGQYDQSE